MENSKQAEENAKNTEVERVRSFYMNKIRNLESKHQTQLQALKRGSVIDEAKSSKSHKGLVRRKHQNHGLTNTIDNENSNTEESIQSKRSQKVSEMLQAENTNESQAENKRVPIQAWIEKNEQKELENGQKVQEDMQSMQTRLEVSLLI